MRLPNESFLKGQKPGTGSIGFGSSRGGVIGFGGGWRVGSGLGTGSGSLVGAGVGSFVGADVKAGVAITPAAWQLLEVLGCNIIGNTPPV